MIVRDKMRRYNEMIRQLNHEGYTTVSNWRTAEEGFTYIHPAENFNPQTMTWKPDARAIGELCWNGSDWIVTWY